MSKDCRNQQSGRKYQKKENTDECYVYKQRGHWARECHSRNYGNQEDKRSYGQGMQRGSDKAQYGSYSAGMEDRLHDRYGSSNTARSRVNQENTRELGRQEEKPRNNFRRLDARMGNYNYQEERRAWKSRWKKCKYWDYTVAKPEFHCHQLHPIIEANEKIGNHHDSNGVVLIA